MTYPFNQSVKIVDVVPPSITVGDAIGDFGLSFGGKVIKVNGEVLIEVHYVHPWTDNQSVVTLAEKIAALLRGGSYEAKAGA